MEWQNSFIAIKRIRPRVRDERGGERDVEMPRSASRREADDPDEEDDLERGQIHRNDSSDQSDEGPYHRVVGRIVRTMVELIGQNIQQHLTGSRVIQSGDGIRLHRCEA